MRLHFIFTEGPGPASQFVECEDDEQNSLKAGEWSQREDGLWDFTVETNYFTAYNE